MIDKKNRIKNRFRSLRKNNMTSYETPDLYLASFLKTKNVILEGIRKEGKKTFFIFRDKEISRLITEYLNDSTVPVLTFKACLRDLRSIIFNYQPPIENDQ